MAKFTPKQFIQQCNSMARTLPSAITEAVMDSAIIAENHFDNNFENGGFQGDAFRKWAPNAPATIRHKNHSKVLLGKTGNLRKSKKVFMGNISGLRSASIWYSSLGKNGVDYAPLMQNGFTTSPKSISGDGDKVGAEVPARPFIGGSKKLDGRIHMTLSKRIKMVFTRNYTIGR